MIMHNHNMLKRIIIFYFILFFFTICLLNLILFFKNPIYAIFSFIAFIFFVIIILLFFQVEFLTYLLLIIYVGAIAVLFLFAIILLNLKETINSSNNFNKELFYIYLYFLILLHVINGTANLFDLQNIFYDSSILFTKAIFLIFNNLDVNFFLFICVIILTVGHYLTISKYAMTKVITSRSKNNKYFFYFDQLTRKKVKNKLIEFIVFLFKLIVGVILIILGIILIFGVLVVIYYFLDLYLGPIIAPLIYFVIALAILNAFTK